MNQPAFPRPASAAHAHGMHSPQEGMTLRDYFAAKAMQGLIGCPDWRESAGEDADMDASDYTALTAYQMADAMLKAREA